jgi:phage tail sheath protein FI
VAAFVDVFAQGPTDVAIKLSGPGDFERAVGGVCSFSEASLAINQFFVNGGQQAWVVRVEAPGSSLAKADLRDQGGEISMTALARNVGKWGEQLMVGVQGDRKEPAIFFDLVVGRIGTRGAVEVQEVFRHLSLDATSKDYYLRKINLGSQLITVEDGAGAIPAPITPAPAGSSGTSGTSGSSGTFGTSGSSGIIVSVSRPEDLATTRQPQWFAPLVGGRDGNVDAAVLDSNELTHLVIGDAAKGSGLYALDAIAPEIFNILCLPVTRLLEDDDRQELVSSARDFCEDRRAMFIIDPPPTEPTVTSARQLSGLMETFADTVDPHPNTAVYFPNLAIPDPFASGTRQVGPSGTMAGIWARTDVEGVWVAPAGSRAQTRGARPIVVMDEAASAKFNPLGFNVIRTFPVFNNVVWGARTNDGADLASSPWKYIPVRRTALTIQSTLLQSLQWAVFRPNDERLWAQLRLSVGAYMHRLFTLGAFGSSDPAEAYIVKCDADTTSGDDQRRGVVNILVGFLPQMVTEFVVIQHQLLVRPSEV